MERIVEREVSMKILSFGSLNIDYVYKVSHFVKKGEIYEYRDADKDT